MPGSFQRSLRPRSYCYGKPRQPASQRGSSELAVCSDLIPLHFVIQLDFRSGQAWGRECVCCVFSSYSFWTSSSLDVPAGVTQEEGHAGFLIHFLSAVRALIFLARKTQPFLSLVDREVEFCVLTISSFSTRWAFLF